MHHSTFGKRELFLVFLFPQTTKHFRETPEKDNWMKAIIVIGMPIKAKNR